MKFLFEKPNTVRATAESAEAKIINISLAEKIINRFATVKNISETNFNLQKKVDDNFLFANENCKNRIGIYRRGGDLKVLKYPLFILLFCFVICGCSSESKPIPKPPEPLSLLGTDWKLLGYFDIEKNELREVEPICELSNHPHGKFSFVIHFSDSIDWIDTVHGIMDALGCPNHLFAFFYADYSLSTLKFIEPRMTAVNSCDEESHYGVALSRVKSFSFTDEELKLFYNDYYTDKKKYLLFKSIDYNWFKGDREDDYD